MENITNKVDKNSKIANIQFILSIMIVMIHANTSFMNIPGSDFKTVF